MPYLWLPSVDGKLRSDRRPGGRDRGRGASIGTLLDALDFAFMITGEARKGRWLIATDEIYIDWRGRGQHVQSVDFNLGPGPISVSTGGGRDGKAGLKVWGWTPAAPTRRWGGEGEPRRHRRDAIVGPRAKTSSQLNAVATGFGPAGRPRPSPAGERRKSEGLWAGIVGAKGRVAGESPWLRTTTSTWVAGRRCSRGRASGMGYAFRWGDVMLDYRYLYYSQSGDKLIDNVRFGGFALGANFRF